MHPSADQRWRRLIAWGFAGLTVFAPPAPLLAAPDTLRKGQTTEQPQAQSGLEETLKRTGRQVVAWLNTPATPTAPAPAAGLGEGDEEFWVSATSVMPAISWPNSPSPPFQEISHLDDEGARRLARAWGLSPAVAGYSDHTILIRERPWGVPDGDRHPFFAMAVREEAGWKVVLLTRQVPAAQTLWGKYQAVGRSLGHPDSDRNFFDATPISENPAGPRVVIEPPSIGHTAPGHPAPSFKVTIVPAGGLEEEWRKKLDGQPVWLNGAEARRFLLRLLERQAWVSVNYVASSMDIRNPDTVDVTRGATRGEFAFGRDQSQTFREEETFRITDADHLVADRNGFTLYEWRPDWSPVRLGRGAKRASAIGLLTTLGLDAGLEENWRRKLPATPMVLVGDKARTFLLRLLEQQDWVSIVYVADPKRLGDTAPVAVTRGPHRGDFAFGTDPRRQSFAAGEIFRITDRADDFLVADQTGLTLYRWRSGATPERLGQRVTRTTADHLLQTLGFDPAAGLEENGLLTSEGVVPVTDSAGRRGIASPLIVSLLQDYVQHSAVPVALIVPIRVDGTLWRYAVLSLPPQGEIPEDETYRAVYALAQAPEFPAYRVYAAAESARAMLRVVPALDQAIARDLETLWEFATLEEVAAETLQAAEGADAVPTLNELQRWLQEDRYTEVYTAAARVANVAKAWWGIPGKLHWSRAQAEAWAALDRHVTLMRDGLATPAAGLEERAWAARRGSEQVVRLSDIAGALDPKVGIQIARFLRTPGIEVRVARIGAGQQLRWHRHRRIHEYYLNLKGTAVMQIGTATKTVGPGAVVRIPAGAAHTVLTTEPMDLLFCFATDQREYHREELGQRPPVTEPEGLPDTLVVPAPMVETPLVPGGPLDVSVRTIAAGQRLALPGAPGPETALYAIGGTGTIAVGEDALQPLGVGSGIALWSRRPAQITNPGDAPLTLLVLTNPSTASPETGRTQAPPEPAVTLKWPAHDSRLSSVKEGVAALRALLAEGRRYPIQVPVSGAWQSRMTRLAGDEIEGSDDLVRWTVLSPKDVSSVVAGADGMLYYDGGGDNSDLPTISTTQLLPSGLEEGSAWELPRFADISAATQQQILTGRVYPTVTRTLPDGSTISVLLLGGASLDDALALIYRLNKAGEVGLLGWAQGGERLNGPVGVAPGETDLRVPITEALNPLGWPQKFSDLAKGTPELADEVLAQVVQTLATTGLGEAAASKPVDLSKTPQALDALRMAREIAVGKAWKQALGDIRRLVSSPTQTIEDVLRPWAPRLLFTNMFEDVPWVLLQGFYVTVGIAEPDAGALRTVLEALPISRDAYALIAPEAAKALRALPAEANVIPVENRAHLLQLLGLTEYDLEPFRAATEQTQALFAAQAGLETQL